MKTETFKLKVDFYYKGFKGTTLTVYKSILDLNEFDRDVKLREHLGALVGCPRYALCYLCIINRSDGKRNIGPCRCPLQIITAKFV